MKAKWLNEHLREAFIDYHNGAITSDLMENFDAKAYVDTLARAHANRHTSFIKCHHGLVYFPTEKGTPHPYLKGDMFGGILDECNKRDIAVMAYLNVCRDGHAYDTNPDWRQCDRDGNGLFHRGIKYVCVNSPYGPELLWPLIDETMDRYPSIKGFFFDGTLFQAGGCYCEYCRRKMAAEGVNANSADALNDFQVRSLREFIDATTARIQARLDDPAVYYNCSDYVGKMGAQEGQVYSIIESLPSAWGYERTAFFGRYYKTKGVHVCAQTGRFHKAWADFGGLKPDISLRYDAALALSLGCSFAIGDQGNPDGTLDQAVYEAEGKAFRYYEEREEWALSDSVPYVGALCRKHHDHKKAKDSWPTLQGLTNALIEEHVHFDPIDFEADLSPYTAIVAEDLPMPDTASAERLRDYVKNGGRLLTLGASVFTGAGQDIIEETLGVKYAGLSPYTDHYIRTPDGPLGDGLAKTDWLTYGSAIHMRPTTAEPFAELVYPFTEATAARNVSHCQGHPASVAAFPAAVVNKFGEGMTASVATPLAALYSEHAYQPLRIFLGNLLKRLIAPDDRALEVTAPMSTEVRLMAQEGRQIVHLLDFNATRASSSTKVTVLEETRPVLDAQIRVQRDNDPTNVYLAPTREALPWTREGKHIVIDLPRFDLHAMVVLED